MSCVYRKDRDRQQMMVMVTNLYSAIITNAEATYLSVAPERI